MLLTQLTTEQFEWYDKMSGGFHGMEFTFSSCNGTFGFYGQFHISQAEQVYLENLLMAHSCNHLPELMKAEIAFMRNRLMNGWPVTIREEDRLEAIKDDFTIELFSEVARDNTMATHLVVSYGDPSIFRKQYFKDDFDLKPEEAKADSLEDLPSRYYPVSSNRCPEKAERINVTEFAQRTYCKDLIAFTGAGISAASGIPAFEGAGGLQERFPIDSYQFPRAVADWMIDRPRESAAILGEFYTHFMTAAPTPGHQALAELERCGVLKQIITGNFDMLHERAGSKNVRINEPKYFGDSDKGWGWIQEGEVALVIGVSTDADNGLLDYARANGIQIAVVDSQQPSFLHAQDWFVKGSADDILPVLAKTIARCKRCQRYQTKH